MWVLLLQAPTTDWFLSHETQEMVAGHRAIWTWLENQLEELAVGRFVVNHNGVEKSFYLLPQHRGRFFIINLHGPNGGEPLPLVFNLHNLYFAGFKQNNRWFVFDDADMLGSGYEEPENDEYWRFLGFSGGYTRNMLTEVNLGIDEFVVVYDTLIRYPDYMNGKRIYVEKCCFRVMAGLCEAWRFPWWNDRVIAILSSYESSPVDRPGIIVNTFEDLFHSWDKLSVRLLIGPLLFHTLPFLPRFPEYGLMMPAVDVLLRPQLGLAAATEGDVGEAEEEGLAAAAEGEEGEAEEEGLATAAEAVGEGQY